MKKIIVLILALSFVIVMAGCGKTAASASAAKSQSVSSSSVPTSSSLPAGPPSSVSSIPYEAASDVMPLLLSEVETPAPDFLTVEQQKLYRAAEYAFARMTISTGFSMDTSKTYDAGDGWIYNLDNGFKTYAELKSYLSQIFSDGIVELLLTSDPHPQYIEHDGKLYCMGGARGTNIFYVNSTFEKDTATADKIEFFIVGHFSNGVVPQAADPLSASSVSGPTLTEERFSVAMEKTANGWRFSSFTLPY